MSMTHERTTARDLEKFSERTSAKCARKARIGQGDFHTPRDSAKPRGMQAIGAGRDDVHRSRECS